MTKQIEKEFNELMEKIKKEPGVEDLFEILGRHEEYKKTLDRYFGIIKPRTIFSVSDSSSN